MNELEIIGIFCLITFLTFLVWFTVFIIVDKDNDKDTDISIIYAFIITIVMLIIILSWVVSEYIGSERKIDEYKEKFSKYEKMEVEDGSGN